MDSRVELEQNLESCRVRARGPLNGILDANENSRHIKQTWSFSSYEAAVHSLLSILLGSDDSLEFLV